MVIGCSASAAPTLSQASGPDSGAGSPSITGTWNLVSIQPAGEAVQSTPDAANYSLTLSDGRLSTRADCNSCSGTFTISGSTLTAGPALACTRAACPTMAFENTYTKLLGGEHTVTLSGNKMLLSSARGVLRFVR